MIMANNLSFQVLFIISLAFGTSLRAYNAPISTTKYAPHANLCSVPAPDSFRVKNGGSTFVTLVWSAAWVGADHTLKVYKKNENTSSWNLINTFYSVPGISFTVTGLLYGAEHRFMIATNCASGDPSELTSSIDFINLILDLMVAGRNPVNPMPVTGVCPTINYQNFNWVGFMIRNVNNFSPQSTLYEFVADYDDNDNLYPVIKRVQEHGPIMALGKPIGWPIFIYPKKPTPQVVSIEGSTTFLVRQYLSEDNHIIVGNVTVNLIEGPFNTIMFCPNSNWNQGYELIPLTAQMANGFSPIESIMIGKKDLHVDLGIKVQSPFKDFVQVFLPSTLTKEEPLLIRITSLEGQMMFQQEVNPLSEVI